MLVEIETIGVGDHWWSKQQICFQFISSPTVIIAVRVTVVSYLYTWYYLQWHISAVRYLMKRLYKVLKMNMVFSVFFSSSSNKSKFVCDVSLLLCDAFPLYTWRYSVFSDMIFLLIYKSMLCQERRTFLHVMNGRYVWSCPTRGSYS